MDIAPANSALLHTKTINEVHEVDNETTGVRATHPTA